MMRVHGDLTIRRRADAPSFTNYKDYETILKEDFGKICGYCGKSLKVCHRGFEIDHFVPVSTDCSRLTDYTNLVWSCFNCNRSKGNHWPTNDPSLPNDGSVGFVDPATKEYDAHLERSLSGAIRHKTPVGKYICDRLKLTTRPMDMVWKIMELDKRKSALRKLAASTGYDEYLALDEELDTLMNRIIDKGE